MVKIGVIGARGKFGSSFCSKIKQVYGLDIELLKTEDKLHNQQIAKEADIAVLAVPPSEVQNVAKEIAKSLSQDAELVSFAAGVSLGTIQKSGIKNPMRAMMDPDATIGMVLNESSNNTKFENIFSDILRYPVSHANQDKDIDEFTVGISYLFTVLLWAFQEHEEEAESWVVPYFDLIGLKLQVTKETLKEIMEKVGNEGDFDAKLKKKATKGGITAAFVKKLRESPNVEARALYEAGIERMDQITNQLN